MDNSKQQRPFLSVILNFYDPRGMAEHVRSWTEKQTLPDDQFEVIAVTTANRSSLADDLKKYLRPQDQLICLETNCPFELYEPAVKAAKGEMLFLSEDHCLARNNCLEAAMEYMASSDKAGATVRMEHINRNRVALMEQLTCERDFATWFEEGHWNKLRIRGFILRRDAFEEAGGFNSRYKNFSEAILSARLHEAGHEIDYVDKGGVRHINTTAFSELFSNVWKYAYHECLFCDENDPEFCEKYFTGGVRFLRSHGTEGPTKGWILRAIWNVICRGGQPLSARLSLLKYWISLARTHLAGIPGSRLAAYCRLALTRLRYAAALGNQDRQYRAFEDFWCRGADCGQVDYLAKRSVESARSLPAWSPPEGIRIPALQAIGLHEPESYEGKKFLWSEPSALFSFSLPPDDYTITVETAGYRDMMCGIAIGVFWNRVRLTGNCIEGNRWQGTIPRSAFQKEGEQQLTLIVSPLPSGKSADTRKLGLPLMGIDFQKSEEPGGDSL